MELFWEIGRFYNKLLSLDFIKLASKQNLLFGHKEANELKRDKFSTKKNLKIVPNLSRPFELN